MLTDPRRDLPSCILREVIDLEFLFVALHRFLTLTRFCILVFLVIGRSVTHLGVQLLCHLFCYCLRLW